MGARKQGYISVAGTRISTRGLMVYSLLRQGRTMKWIADELGISIGTMSGYIKRAVKLGFIEPRKNKRVFVAISQVDGARYEFRGRKQVEDAGFSYQTAWHAASEERKSAGFFWHFEEDKKCEA